MLVLCIVSLFLATKYADFFAGFGMKYTRLFAEAAKMYVIGAVAIGAIFFFIRGRTRAYWLRAFILYAAMTIDIFLSASYIVSRIS